MDDVLSIVKTRLGLTDDSEDELINSYIEEIGNRIKHYCNIDEIPENLKYVWASIVQHLVFYVQRGYKGETGGSISTIKIGDTQTTMNQPNKLISPSISNKMIDEIILNFKADLDRYRKLRW